MPQYSIPHFQLSLNLFKETDNNPIKCQSEIKFKHLRHSDFWIQEHSTVRKKSIAVAEQYIDITIKNRTICSEADEISGQFCRKFSNSKISAF